MRRTIFICLLLVCVLAASAQIQRNILGCTLGATSKAQAINNLKTNNYLFGEPSESSINIYNVFFGGHKWEVASMKFYNDSFYDIEFMDFKLDPLDTFYYDIGNALDHKYSNYRLMCDRDEDGSIYRIFSDNIVEIFYYYSCSPDANSLFLSYRHKPISKAK